MLLDLPSTRRLMGHPYAGAGGRVERQVDPVLPTRPGRLSLPAPSREAVCARTPTTRTHPRALGSRTGAGSVCAPQVAPAAGGHRRTLVLRVRIAARAGGEQLPGQALHAVWRTGNGVRPPGRRLAHLHDAPGRRTVRDASWPAREWCRVALGEPMASPRIRRRRRWVRLPGRVWVGIGPCRPVRPAVPRDLVEGLRAPARAAVQVSASFDDVWLRPVRGR